MTSRQWVITALCAAAVLLGAGEAIALVNPALGDTISELVWGATFELPLIPLAAGVLMGHFFFPKGKCVLCGGRPWAAAPSDRLAFMVRLERFANLLRSTRDGGLHGVREAAVAAGFPDHKEGL